MTAEPEPIVMRKLLLIAVAVVFTTATSAAARDVFVDNRAGDDHFDARFPTTQFGLVSGPARTIAKAIRLASAGDRIILANTGVPYQEEVSLSGPRKSGFSFRPLVIEGNGAMLDGSAPATGWQPAGGDVFRFRPERMAFGVLFLQGRPLVRIPSGPPGEGPPQIQPLQWALHDGWIYFRVERDRLPAQYQLSYARMQVGITLYKVSQVVIRNLVVQGFELDGINCQDVRPETILDHVTAHWNGRSGIAICGASRATLDGCLLDGNGQSQLHIEGTSEANAIGSELLPKSAPAWLIHGGRLQIDGRAVGQ
jgi:hypothetical protein